MENLIERVARHADIDTRRALGVKPGKLGQVQLVLPNFHVERDGAPSHACVFVHLGSGKTLKKVVYTKDRSEWYVWNFNGREYTFYKQADGANLVSTAGWLTDWPTEELNYWSHERKTNHYHTYNGPIRIWTDGPHPDALKIM